MNGEYFIILEKVEDIIVTAENTKPIETIFVEGWNEEKGENPLLI